MELPNHLPSLSKKKKITSEPKHAHWRHACMHALEVEGGTAWERKGGALPHTSIYTNLLWTEI